LPSKSTCSYFLSKINLIHKLNLFSNQTSTASFCVTRCYGLITFTQVRVICFWQSFLIDKLCTLCKAKGHKSIIIIEKAQRALHLQLSLMVYTHTTSSKIHQCKSGWTEAGRLKCALNKLHINRGSSTWRIKMLLMQSVGGTRAIIRAPRTQVSLITGTAAYLIAAGVILNSAQIMIDKFWLMGRVMRDEKRFAYGKALRFAAADLREK
jgi:hypothetical protein